MKKVYLGVFDVIGYVKKKKWGKGGYPKHLNATHERRTLKAMKPFIGKQVYVFFVTKKAAK